VASAADMAVKARPPAQPAAAPSWTGFYVGLGLGGRWDEVTGSVLGATNNGGNIFCTAGTVGNCNNTSLDSSAFRVSGYLGYNWQFAPLWVAGIEGDFGWADNKSTLNGAIYPGGNFPFYITGRPGDVFTFKSDWDAGLRGRLGYLINPSLLLFATGGVEWMQIKTDSQCGSLSDCLPGVFAFLFAPQDIGHTTTMTGWTIGGGLEWMWTPEWLLRAEYRYADFGTATFTDTRTNIGFGITQVATYSVDVRTHTALFGIARKF
jgi:outer membrane immunogenic protein